ncbi:MAG: ABC transporter ATP-binding protein [Pseudomonadota bacterium]
MALEFKSVTFKRGGETHIYETDLALEPGGFNTLLGTTLSGKTTLMQLMAGILKPTTGEIWFDGRNVTGVSVQKRNVSMVYQQFINYPNMTVFENIASPLWVAGVARREVEERVGRFADLLKLTPMLKRKPSELSGGQQQRTAMARALVKDADLVLLDEPLANLDFKLREELRDELPKLFADRNCTVVYATTEPTEALLLGGHTAALHEGRVIAFGPTGNLYRRPTNLKAAEVFSEPPINAIRADKSGDRFTIDETAGWNAGEGDLAALPDGTYYLGVRPHHLTPSKDGDNGPAVALQGRIIITEISGSESVIHFAHEGQTLISQAHGVHAFDIGDMASFAFDPAKCLIFDEAGARISAKGVA